MGVADDIRRARGFDAAHLLQYSSHMSDGELDALRRGAKFSAIVIRRRLLKRDDLTKDEAQSLEILRRMIID